jgi:protoheme IX farnesyltransferase
MGWIYAIGAFAGGGYFVAACIRLALSPARDNAWRAFAASIVQLGLLMLAAILDRLLLG